MRYGVLADIHANLPALRAAVEELRGRGVERWLVIGDLVGYGAQPNECLEEVAALEPISVAGNHDLIAVGKLSDERCIPLAQQSLRWTRSMLSPESRAWLQELPLRASAPGGVVIAHGSIDDPQAYSSTREQVLPQLLEVERVGGRVLLLAHTHRAMACCRSFGLRGPRATLRLPSEHPTMLNPGAVGQSRELRLRARALLLDTDAGTAEFLAFEYDVATAREALRRAGLPEGNVHLRPSLRAVAGRSLRRALDARPLPSQRPST